MAADGSRSAVIAALIGNSVIAIMKFAAAAITQSAAMFSEGLHSIADVGNQVLLMRGMSVAKRPPDVQHPFGRGKEVYFWSFMVAVMLFVGGAVLAFVRGLDAIRNPHQVESFIPGFIVLGLAFVIETFAFRVALREFDEERGSRGIWRSVQETTDTLVLVVLFEDSAALTGLLIAAIGLGLTWATGDSVWDGVASIGIAVLLVGVAVVLAIETKALLIGEAAGRAERSAMRRAILTHRHVERIARLLTMHIGLSRVLVNLDVDLIDGLTTEEVERTIDEIEEAIREVIPEAAEIFVEVQSVHG